MSSINTGAIDVNYPLPGVNNNSQGFRDNFAAISNNLDIAANEITELQSKALLKSPLEGTAINNNMNNTLISNALIQGFRNTTFNLGNNLSGNITIDVTNGDVQYGTITANVNLGFSKWAPVGTRAQIILILAVSNTALSSTIGFPAQVDASITTIENVTARTVTFPRGVTTLEFVISTEDCGSTLTIEPLNRPRQSTQIVTTVPASNLGAQGDKTGAIAVDANHLYVCVANYNGATAIWKRIALSAW